MGGSRKFVIRPPVVIPVGQVLWYESGRRTGCADDLPGAVYSRTMLMLRDRIQRPQWADGEPPEEVGVIAAARIDQRLLDRINERRRAA